MKKIDIFNFIFLFKIKYKIILAQSFMAKVGYIYVRIHEAYDLYGVCKLGKTQNITNRESGYITGEFVKGDFSYG